MSFRRLFRLAGRSVDPAADLEAEFRFHLEQQEDDLVRQGWSRAAARAEAMRRFGDLEAFRNRLTLRDHRHQSRHGKIQWLADLGRDLTLGGRQVVRQPLFAAGVALTLGLGIGANAAIFRLIDAIVLRPLPGVVAPSELVEITPTTLSYPAYRRFATEASAALEVAAHRVRTLSVGVGSTARPEPVAIVSGTFFGTLRARPYVGRLLGPSDDEPAAAPAVVLSHAFWRRAFGARPDVVGQTVAVNGTPLTVVGVAAPGFRGLRVFDRPVLWVAINSWPSIVPSSLAYLSINRPTWGWLTGFGRLKAGTTVERAREAIATAASREYDALGVPANRRTPIELRPAVSSATGTEAVGLPRLLALMMGAVGLVLALACANVATLLLARSQGRTREFAVRAALGGGRGRLMRQLIAESLVLGGVGAVMAFGCYRVVLGLLGGLSLPGGVALDTVGLELNGRAVFAVAVLALISAVTVGFGPALRAGAQRTVAAISPLNTRSGPAPSWGRRALISFQLALALVLLVGATLFGRSVRNALAVDLGFQPGGLSLVSVDLGLLRYGEESAQQFYGRALEAVRSIPGVDAASWALTPPLAADEWVESYQVAGEPSPPDGQSTEWTAASPDFFATIGARIVEGRAFEPTDLAGAPHVAVVNRAFAAPHWAGRRPLGGRISLGTDTLVVVGVVDGLRMHSLSGAEPPLVVTALQQRVGEPVLSEVTLLVKGASGRAPSSFAIATALRGLDSRVPIRELGSYQRVIDQVLLPQRLAFALLGVFGVLAVAVAGVGVYSVMAHQVAGRVWEFGVRMALGASPGRIVRLAIRDQVAPVVIGVTVGAALGVILARFASGLLFGITAFDPGSLALAIGLLVAVALGAAFLPAWRGSRLRPVDALRTE